MKMATIRKRGEYQWQAIVKRKGHPIQRRTFTYRKDAEAWAREVEAEIERGTWRDRTEAERTTIAEALDRYLAEVAVHKKGSGYHNNKCQANVIKRHRIAHLSLARLGTHDVAQYRDDRLKVVKPNTVRLELALLSHLYTVAQQEWGMPYLTNPAKIIKKPSVSRSARDRRLAPGEEEQLLQACREHHSEAFADLVAFALETGMRRGEIAQLRHGDIQGKVAVLLDTKNGERRDVPLSSRARAILARRAKVRSLKDDRVFCLEDATISRTFRKVCDKAGIEDLKFHDLRHEATSRLFEKGLNPMQVAAITGHKTLQMLKRYTHLRAEDLAEMLG